MNLSAWGLLAVLAGTILIVIDGSKYFKTIRAILEAHQLTMETMFSKEDIPVFTGMDKWLEEADIRSRTAIIAGLALIVLGTILQFLGSLKW